MSKEIGIELLRDLADRKNRETADDMFVRLGELQSELSVYTRIESELGIDLYTLFKALKDGIYYVLCEGYGSYCIPTLDVRNKCLVKHNVDFDCGIESHWDKSFPLKDYGKTWALTKEELGERKWN